jgi:hypothetical protein
MARLVGPLAALVILAMGCGPALAVQAMDDGPFYAVKGSTLKIKISDLLANDLPANGQKVINRVFKIKNMAGIQTLSLNRKKGFVQIKLAKSFTGKTSFRYELGNPGNKKDGGVRREAQHPGALWYGSGRERQIGMERCRAGRI